MNFEKLLSAIYAEEDFGRSVATAIAGAAGLIVYLFASDWVLGAFVAVITFPVVRVLATAANSQWRRRRAASERVARAQEEFDRYSPQEKQVIEFFVHAGGCCVSWSAVNRSDLPFPRPAVNSLIERGVVRTTVMEDGMTEAFALDADVFDLAQQLIVPDSADPIDDGV